MELMSEKKRFSNDTYQDTKGEQSSPKTSGVRKLMDAVELGRTNLSTRFCLF